MSPIDFLVLLGLLGAITVFGLWRGLRKQENTQHDLLVGRGVSVFPMALAVASSCLSAVSLLGFPAEVYSQGAMIYWYAIMYLIAFPTAAFVFVPIFYELRLCSVYEYLQKRFNFQCRLLASCIFFLQMQLYVSVVLYAPALALSAVTVIPLSVSILATGILAAGYTAIGGAKAVIHTSALQMMLIYIGLAAVMLGGFALKSPAEVFESTRSAGRLRLNEIRLDPRIRHSIWTLLIGGSGTTLSLFATSQLSLQRYMAMPTLRSAQLVVLLNIPINAFVLTLYVLIGLIVYAVYQDCDPGLVKSDQLLPYFVMDRLSWLYGLPGLFLAAVYSAGLSTLSGTYSALSAVAIEDILKAARTAMGYPALTAKISAQLSRILPVVFAAISIGLAFAFSLAKSTVLQVALSLFGMAGGPVLGVFCLGVFLPWIRPMAAFWGLLISIVCSFCISFGALIYQVRPVKLPVGNCTDAYGNGMGMNFNQFGDYGMVHPLDSEHWWIEIFRISYQYYSTIGIVLVLFIAVVGSIFTGFQSKTSVSPSLISPIVRRLLNLDDTKMISQLQEFKMDNGDPTMEHLLLTTKDH